MEEAFALVKSRAPIGIDTVEVSIEVHLTPGLPSLQIVGLPDTALRESRERVRSAIRNSRYDFPPSRITVNLAPADLPKDGGRFDLAIALGILAASGQIDERSLIDYEFSAELALSGALRPTHQTLAIAKGCIEAGRCLVLAQDNAYEASFINDLSIYPANSLLHFIEHLKTGTTIKPYVREDRHVVINAYPNLSEVHGQFQAKRAFEIAAAGGHHIMMMGPPGTGKTMLACRMPGILPELNEIEALESGLLYSLAKKHVAWGVRPFRSPHHTLSNVALVGGGNPPRPGEISLSHHGILFLDEFPEYKRSSLESLREPMEAASIHIARANHAVQFPANFQLVAAMNPCPCGYVGHAKRTCDCSEHEIRNYRRKISGPILDRIDLQINVEALEYKPGRIENGECSSAVAHRVRETRDLQHLRSGCLNARLSDKQLARELKLDINAQRLVDKLVTDAVCSNRGIARMLRVARTIADLAKHTHIAQEDLLEAYSYRREST